MKNIIIVASVVTLFVAAWLVARNYDTRRTLEAPAPTNTPPRVYLWTDMAIGTGGTNPPLMVQFGFREDNVVIWRDKQ